ncbi:carboxylating nicotinate-nucleotide diphosphorylase [Kineococcus sp. R8]|uniref:carboxylating nicotinate-nucleotide diphosphorylase n=1 Tax=Kineococcus siccus TaxID=2696567 RepID=UPI00141316EB|nr:carboxylating nicotinate-nucleotide diphosphorylase [Kineococcus siccus]NAZ80730.1 carboxylating nicotinate-nucleotide diphosphorylase [Kineococcus siccus]
MSSHAAAAAVVAAALAEDAPWGDLTSDAVVPAGSLASAELRAREPGVLAGGAAVHEAFTQAARLAGTAVRVTDVPADGTAFAAGDVLGRVAGDAHAVLRAERVALNLLQHLSGVATTTAAFVAQVAGTRARVVDTRKTTPGLRALERAAVRAGGGHNHRWSLSDAVLVKDNHLAVLTAGGLDVTTALKAVRDKVPHTTVVEVEVDSLDQLDAVLAADVDVVLLDNFSLADLAEGVRRVAGRALVEASGGVRLDTVRAIAGTGVDLVSVGALTQNSPTLDIGLDIALVAAA